MRNSKVKEAAKDGAARECHRRAVEADSPAPETVCLAAALDASGVVTTRRSSHRRKDRSKNWNTNKGSVALGHGQGPEVSEELMGFGVKRSESSCNQESHAGCDLGQVVAVL